MQTPHKTHHRSLSNHALAEAERKPAPAACPNALVHADQVSRLVSVATKNEVKQASQFFNL
ncbi:hypothetical protein COU74_02965 [Candidatus Peregrinibacteria bacterium CG10_big_fil_rev_8_21_14_0_10_36_19]|nr:MAG: hypothetical protein COU74_02965 [Candidatus Peregrinibacteria bacterium CG10_big_fil_rev_8_21_14_0_10_36_19]